MKHTKKKTKLRTRRRVTLFFEFNKTGANPLHLKHQYKCDKEHFKTIIIQWLLYFKCCECSRLKWLVASINCQIIIRIKYGFKAVQSTWNELKMIISTMAFILFDFKFQPKCGCVCVCRLKFQKKYAHR